MENDTGRINGYHAHIYFDEDTISRARKVCETARDLFTLDMGRVHEKAVGPHPMWSCQLAFENDQFDRIVPWLALHRDNLIVFIHPNTGDDLADHRDHAIWMGDTLTLKLDIFG